jgi:hypothetical protein
MIVACIDETLDHADARSRDPQVSVADLFAERRFAKAPLR